jgi:hypothetical protein
MLFTLGENRHEYKSVRGAGEAAADLADFTLLDVIAYGLLHQSYDYCCQLADPDIASVGRTYSLMVKIRTRNDPPHNGHISDHRRRWRFY